MRITFLVDDEAQYSSNMGVGYGVIGPPCGFCAWMSKIDIFRVNVIDTSTGNIDRRIFARKDHEVKYGMTRVGKNAVVVSRKFNVFHGGIPIFVFF